MLRILQNGAPEQKQQHAGEDYEKLKNQRTGREKKRRAEYSECNFHLGAEYCISSIPWIGFGVQNPESRLQSDCEIEQILSTMFI